MIAFANTLWYNSSTKKEGGIAAGRRCGSVETCRKPTGVRILPQWGGTWAEAWGLRPKSCQLLP